MLFHHRKLEVQAEETKVSGRGNQSFKQEKQKFQAGETKVSYAGNNWRKAGWQGKVCKDK